MATLRSGRAGLIGLAVILALLPLVVSNEYYLTVLILVAINAVLAVSLNLLIGHAGLLSLGQGAFYGLGAYGYSLLTTRLQLPPLVAMIGALAVTAAAAYVLGVPTTRLRSHYLAIATLGLAVIFTALATELTDLTGGPNGLFGIPSLGVGALSLSTPTMHYYAVWVALALVLAASWTLIHSRTGRALRAMKTKETAAAILGVDVARLKLAVFVLSAVIAGLAGVLYASFVSFISPESFGFSVVIELLVILAIGGMGTIWGPLVGSAVTRVLGELLRPVKEFSPLIYGLMLILFILFAPAGLAGWVPRWPARGVRSGQSA